MATGRRKRNRISVLKKKNGEWCEGEEETCKEILDYFTHMFLSDNPGEFDEVLQGIPHIVTTEMNRNLIRPVTDQEISRAIFPMHPNKSPGPDGMSPVFFQKFWHIVKFDVIRAVHSFSISIFCLSQSMKL